MLHRSLFIPLACLWLSGCPESGSETTTKPMKTITCKGGGYEADISSPGGKIVDGLGKNPGGVVLRMPQSSGKQELELVVSDKASGTKSAELRSEQRKMLIKVWAQSEKKGSKYQIETVWVEMILDEGGSQRLPLKCP